jgi:hypothetical protein
VASHTSKDVLDYIHLDVWGPVAISSNEGAYYFVRFIDDFLKMVFDNLRKNAK